MMAVLMPITWPERSTSGPPELPGLMAASVCKNLWNCCPMPLRSLALMMPAVTVACSPKGLPIAKTQSPTCTPSELPSFATGSSLLASILITADNLGGIPSGLASQLDLDFCGLLDDVIVREDVAALVHDNARAQAAVRLRGTIRPAVEESVEEILHRIVLVVRLRTSLAGLLFLQNLRSGDVDHRGLNFVYDARKSICRRDGVRHRERRRRCAREPKSFGRRDPARNYRADQDSHDQCEANKYSRQDLTLARPVQKFFNLISHVPLLLKAGPCACIVVGAQRSSTGVHSSPTLPGKRLPPPE